MDEQIKSNIVDNFLSRVSLPAQKPTKLFVLGIIGLPGSGRTTIAKMLASKISGAVVLQANSVRCLLKEQSLPWGDNVRAILKAISNKLLSQGYGIIFDGNAVDAEDRENIKNIASPFGAQVLYLRINIDKELAKKRESDKYNNPKWVSSFEDFRVNSTEKMLQNIEDRAKVHAELDNASIPDLIGEIDNNGSKEELGAQVAKIVEKI